MILRDARADQLWRNVDPLTNPPCPPTDDADFYDLFADPGPRAGGRLRTARGRAGRVVGASVVKSEEREQE